MSKTLGEQWRGYADRPPIARWVSRFSMVIGVLIALGLLAGVVWLAVIGIAALWRLV